MINRILTVALIYTCLLIACKSDAQSWSQGTIRGEGEIVKQEIILDQLKGINLGFSGDVILTPGPSQKIELEGQKNIIENIKRDVRNGIWNINFIKNVRDAKEVKVYVTVPSLESVGLAGSGSIHSTGKFTGINTMDIDVSGSGDVMLDYEAQATNLALSGSGKINLKGSSRSLEISISGSGNVNAPDLMTEDCAIHISGSGDASVNASKTLETNISGSGDVSYSGTASVTTRISGSGEVSKIK
jgi:hypothetical protein